MVTLGFKTIKQAYRYTEGYSFDTDLYVPESFTVSSPRVVCPTKIRAWEINLWEVDKKILTYKNLTKLDGFSGTYAYNQLICIESWESIGREGHIEYKHIGYRIITQKSLHKYKTERKKDIERYGVSSCCMTDFFC